MPDGDQRKQDGGRIEVAHENQTWLAILEQMPLGVVVAEVPSGRFQWHNKQAERILGHATIPVSGVGDYMRYAGLHEDGRPYQAHEYPLARAVLDGEVVEREPLRYRHGDERLIVLEVSASRLTAPRGEPLAICTFQDVTAEYEARRAWQEAAERVQLALDAGAIVGTWVRNVPEDRLTADELFARCFGLDPERCRTGLPSEDALKSVHPADRPSVKAAIGEALARGGAYHHRYRVLHHDGVYRWVEASGRVEMDETGKAARFPGVLVDITTSKQAEEARDLLMREVDHRARNVLAMVQSLVRLTEASDPTTFQDALVGRIDAMARAQGSLSRSNWGGGVLEDVVREELSCCAEAPRFRLAGPRITLLAHHVQPLNMIIHELATNAMKYGALSVRGGMVEVAWKTTRRHEVALTWKEGGGPVVKTPMRTGFGSRLIRRLAAQLGGSVEIDWQATGLVANLAWRCR
jgi:PAS domain S-box-containing protein